MLTKDLIQCRSSGNCVYPKFIQVTRPDLLELASQMLAVLDNGGQRLTRGEISERLEEVGNTCFNVKLATGLRKILEDRLLFASTAEIDYQEERKRLFLASADILRNAPPADETAYRQAVWTSAPGPLASPDAAIYADLPENDICQGIRSLTPQELLERYNCGLVQGLLLQCKRLELDVTQATTAALRRLMSAAKFCRLVCDIRDISSKFDENVTKSIKRAEKSDEDVKSVRLVVDGPASVLSQARSYGLQLALFFPSVCALPHWHLRADVQWKERNMRLDLDEHSRLVSRDHNAGYEPEEYQVFQKQFSEKAPHWCFEEPLFLKSFDGQLVVPDFVLRRKGERKRKCIELFHRWHSTPLLQRLQALEKGEYPQLIIGVDKAIASRKEVDEALTASEAFQKRGFLYRDYPTVDKVLRCLESEP